MNEYQKSQAEAFQMVQRHLASLDAGSRFNTPHFYPSYAFRSFPSMVRTFFAGPFNWG